MAKSTHSGLPWLRFLRQRLGERLHFWPFDGWDIPAGRSAIAEVYPALWSGEFAAEGRTADQHDAYAIAAWLARADRDGRLALLLRPELQPSERSVAKVEGWILGVSGLAPPNGTRSSADRTADRKMSAALRLTTQIGYTNRNAQTVLRPTTAAGNDHNQKVYVLRCGKCNHEYGANGSDIWLRRCPSCSGGAKGLAY